MLIMCLVICRAAGTLDQEQLCYYLNAVSRVCCLGQGTVLREEIEISRLPAVAGTFSIIPPRVIPEPLPLLRVMEIARFLHACLANVYLDPLTEGEDGQLRSV